MKKEIIVLAAILIILIGNIFRKTPPPYPSTKQQEYLNFGYKMFICGYMSKRALKSECSWYYANSSFGKKMIILGIFELLLLISIHFISRNFSLGELPQENIEIGMFIVGLIYSIIHTEVKLNQLFN